MSGDGLVFLGTSDAPVDATALKQQAASALERALGFVCEHGDALSELRAQVVLQAQPVAELVDALAARQDDDGSFRPFDLASRGWVGRELELHGADARLCGTLEALAMLADARQDNASCVEAAIRFVESVQRRDGSFGSAGSSSELESAELVQGDDSSDVVVTGISAGSLARSRYARPEVLASAGVWLGERFDADRVAAGHRAERAAFAMYYSNAPDELSDEALQWCGRELEREFRTHALDALAVMQQLLACQVGSLPGASFAPEELLERLLAEQAADGGFEALSPEGGPARVASTTDAMRAVIGLCATF
jgi:hypothetical protein